MICRLGTFFTLIPAFSKTNARAALRCGRVLAVFDILGGGAEQQIAVHGRRDKNALAEFCRQLEDGFINQIARVFVAQAVFAAARGDGERVRQRIS